MTSATMAICTAGKRLLPTGAMAQVALSAVAAKCASTTPWLPRLPWLQLSWTMKQMMVHLTAWWHTAISLLVGFVMSVVTSGLPSHRVNKQRAGCPNCGHHAKTKKRIKHPTFAECQDPRGKALLAEWDHERNAPQGNLPNNTRLQSNKQIFWLCTKCPAGQQHSWPTTPKHRSGCCKSDCPFCAGHAACKCNSLQTLYPDIAAEWDFAKNPPSNHTASSTYLAWWFSSQRGSWQQTINSRSFKVQQGSARLKRIQQRQRLASGS